MSTKQATRQNPLAEDTPAASPAVADVEAHVLQRLSLLQLDCEKDAAEQAAAVEEWR
eukprot:COSAG01_NODE_2069_length_8498_cov_5.965841_8_plen_57_part_00